jgi:50S ribosomal protein L16 3-hydroxylase
MRRYWQKKPLLVRNAFPGWATGEAPPVSMQQVLQEARNDRLPSRMVDAHYALQRGPFRPRQIPSLKTPGWTILVQQTNTVLPSADRFLDCFRFVPEGRLDDLMISVASDQGGIGAHVDSYDVFLIQAQGFRRWEIAQTFDPRLAPGLDLKILQRFAPEQTMVLGPGDLLYLPPQVAHRGTAVEGPCMTYSVGFRAPSAPEIADMAFGQYLDDKGGGDTGWSDPWLEATEHSGELPDRLVLGLAQQAMDCLPTRREIAQEVVVALSAPHPSVYYDTAPPLSARRFLRLLQSSEGLRLSPGSRLLLWHDFMAINGESVALPTTTKRTQQQIRQSLRDLANERELSATRLKQRAHDDPLMVLLWQWFLQGYLVLIGTHSTGKRHPVKA